jgi:hypothetical protein
MDSYKDKFRTKDKALQVVKRGRAGSVYRKGSYWFLTTRKERKLKTFIIMKGFKNERTVNEI